MTTGYGASHASILNALQAGHTVQPGGFYPTTATTTPLGVTDNTSEDMADWGGDEFRRFVKWFIEVNHPEAVKQFQAIRAIERKVEEEELNRRYLAELEADAKLRQMAQAHRAQNAYPYNVSSTQQGYGIAVSTDPPRKSVWDRAKEMAGYK